MPSQYLKCNGCGAVLDRKPGPHQPLFTSYDGGREIREYARSIGWKTDHRKTVGLGEGEDYCPNCAGYR